MIPNQTKPNQTHDLHDNMARVGGRAEGGAHGFLGGVLYAWGRL